MLLIAGTVRVPVENLAAARDAAAAMILATRAEDGCLQYAFAEDLLDPGVIHISEVWRDKGALEGHGKSAHMAVWRTAVRELGVRERNLKIYEVGEGQPL